MTQDSAPSFIGGVNIAMKLSPHAVRGGRALPDGFPGFWVTSPADVVRLIVPPP